MCARQLRTLRQLEPLQPEELSEIRNGGSLETVKTQRKQGGRRHRRGELAMLRDKSADAAAGQGRLRRQDEEGDDGRKEEVEEEAEEEEQPAAPTGERKRKTRGASCAAELPTLVEEEAPKGKRRQSTRLGRR